MIPLSQEVEALIRAKADLTGRTPDEILREALTRAGGFLGAIPSNRDREA